MNMVESFSANARNPSTLAPCRTYTFKFDTGHSAVFYKGFGWMYHNKAGCALNPLKGCGAKVVAAMNQAMKAGI